MSTFKRAKLTEAQQVFLVRASQNEDGELIDPAQTEGIGRNGADENYELSANEVRSIEALHRKGMFEGVLDDLSSLKLTAHAFIALHIDEAEWPKRLRGSAPNPQTSLETPNSSSTAIAKAPRKGTKGATILTLLKRKKGATLLQMEEATEWQHHSIRGFLSGTVRKKLGLELTSEKAKDGTRVYRIASEV